MIVYKHNDDGRAIDIRFEPDDYVLQAGESFIEGDRIPDIETLHQEDVPYIQEFRCDEVDDLRDSKFYEAFVYSARNWDARPKDMFNILARKSYAVDSLNNEISITSVTDSSGVARFNYTGDAIEIGVTITTSGHSESTYNTTAAITASGSDYFEISSISYVDDDSGIANRYPWTVKYSTWRDKDNNDQTFPSQQNFVDFALAVHDYIDEIFRQAMDHKDAIRALTDYTTIENYDITTGW